MIPNLDVLRATAVLLVVACHVGVNLVQTDAFDIEAIGRVGVAVFFVHTSLVLMLSLERSGPAALPFYVRRAFRIYPLAVAMVLLVALGNWLGGVRFPVWGIVSNLLLVQNVTGHPSILAPMWSLPYEVQMYFALPAVFALARARGARGIAVLLASSVVCLTALMAFGMKVTPLQYVPCFLCGVLAYALPRRPLLHPASPIAIVGASTVCIPLLMWAGLPELPMLWALCLGLALCIPRWREFKAGSMARGGALVAKYSYGIYLTHAFAVAAGFRLLPGISAWLKWAIFVFVLVAWARVAYRWIEAPGIALGQRIAQQLGSRRVTAEPPRARA